MKLYEVPCWMIRLKLLNEFIDKRSKPIEIKK